MSSSFLAAVAGRRSHYALSKESPIPDARVTEIVQAALRTVPSSFNNQSVRALVLLGAAHDRFWAAVRASQVDGEPDEARRARTAPRIDGFLGARGTVAFFDDQPTIEKSQASVPAYAPFFTEWAAHTQGMHQFAVWTALSAEGLGANLQHYQFDAKAVEKWRAEFGIGEDWVPKAQLVFGGRGDADPAPKDKLPAEQTVKVVSS